MRIKAQIPNTKDKAAFAGVWPGILFFKNPIIEGTYRSVLVTAKKKVPDLGILDLLLQNYVVKIRY